MPKMNAWDSEENKEPLDQVLDAYRASRDSVVSRRLKFQKYYRNYRQRYLNEDKDKAFNLLFIPLTYEHVSTFRPLLTLKPPTIDVLPRAADDEEAAKEVNSWLEFQWETQQMNRKCRDLALYFLLYGNALLYHYYEITPKTVTYRDIRSKELKEITEERVEYDDPQCEVINIVEDSFPDPYGYDEKTITYWLIRRVVPIDSLDQLKKNHYIDTIPEYLSPLYLDMDAYYSRIRRIYDIWNDVAVVNIARQRLVELFELWTPTQHIIVANRQDVMLDTKNPFGRIPMTWFKNDDVPHELYSVGIGETLEYLQAELNTMRRLRLDNAKTSCKRKWIAREGCQFDPALFNEENESMVTVTGNPGDVLKEWVPTNMEQIGAVTSEEIRMDAGRADGATDFTRGISQADMQSKTATAASLQQTNSYNLFFYKLSNFQLGIESWMKWSFELARRHYPPERNYRLGIGPDLNFKTIGYDSFQREFDFVTQQSANHPLTQQDKVLLGDVMMGRFLNDPDVDQVALKKWYMDNIGIERPERFLLSPQQRQQRDMAMQEQQAQQRDQAFEDEAAKSQLQSLNEPTPGEQQTGQDMREKVPAMVKL